MAFLGTANFLITVKVALHNFEQGIFFGDNTFTNTSFIACLGGLSWPIFPFTHVCVFHILNKSVFLFKYKCHVLCYRWWWQVNRNSAGSNCATCTRPQRVGSQIGAICNWQHYFCFKRCAMVSKKLKAMDNLSNFQDGIECFWARVVCCNFFLET